MIDSLLGNTTLWKIFLRAMPKCKVKDSYLIYISQNINSSVKVNNSDMSDELFFLWWCKAVHVQLTHLRELKRYPDRFKYRISLLSPEDRSKLEDLMAHIQHEDPSEKQLDQLRLQGEYKVYHLKAKTITMTLRTKKKQYLSRIKGEHVSTPS